jgi:hypothetical protein
LILLSKNLSFDCYIQIIKANYMNKIFNLLTLTTLILIISTSIVKSQDRVFVQGKLMEIDKCGYIENEESQLHKITGNKWDYGYDSLLIELNNWKLSQYVKVDSIGLSVQQRPLWRLTISDNPKNISSKRTIHIHARTHPQETEGFWVTREMINILLSESELAQRIRTNCVVYVIPMFNPDGVELEKTRQNANNIDLESNWYTIPNQPEVAALKASFTELLSKPNPMEVMLNIHSSSLCERYFVYHHENGTSIPFTIKEQNFINDIRNYYPDGIAPWNYFVSWTNGTPQQYPESWLWLNYSESVMALTYEDKYRFSCTSGNYDSTANAILRGVMDYMGITTDIEHVADVFPAEFILYQNYPNPFNPITKISFSIPDAEFLTLKVFDILGRNIATLADQIFEPGIHSKIFDASKFTSGIYFVELRKNNSAKYIKMEVLK